MSLGAFNGLRVLDLAWVVAGPLVGRVLASHGATVIRVESKKRVDTARMMGPFPDGVANPEHSALYENCNVGKLGLTLDLSTAQARDVIRDLVAWADVVVESFSPGQMSSWGLGFEDLRAINPDLIMLSTSLMGQTGPWSGFAGFGNVGAAIAGYQAIVGWPERTPVGPYGPYTDFVGPRFALLTLLAALDNRRRTGEGCYLDIAQCEASVQFLAPQIADCAATGRSVEANGNRDSAKAPHGVFRCADPDVDNEGWVAIAVSDDSQWQRLAMCLGGETLCADQRFLTLQARLSRESELEQLLTEWTTLREPNEVERILQGLGIASHNVASSGDLLNDTQLQHRQHFIEVPHDLMGTAVVENACYRMSMTPAIIEKSAPNYGRDNRFVLEHLLGYTSDHIDALEQMGALT